MDIEEAIRGATARIIAQRFNLQNGRMSMSRLSEKLAKARGVVGRQHARIEAKADAIIAREPQIEAQTDEVFAMHETMLDEAQKGAGRAGPRTGDGEQRPFAKLWKLARSNAPHPQL